MEGSNNLLSYTFLCELMNFIQSYAIFCHVKKTPLRDTIEVQNEILETVRNIERFLGVKGVLRIDPSGNLIDASGNDTVYPRAWVTAYEPDKLKKAKTTISNTEELQKEE